MFSKGNPYHVAGPVEDEARFVGRRDVMAWVWQTLAANERLVVLTGAPLIGKSSILLQLARDTRSEYLSVYVDLLAAYRGGEEPLAGYLVDQIHRAALNVESLGGETIGSASPASVWKTLRDDSPTRHPLLLLDNLDLLLSSDSDAGWVFLEDLADLMDSHEDMQIVFAVRSSDGLRRFNRLPFFRAPWRSIGPLNRTEAVQLIKQPADGLLDFDYDTVARIDELTGRLPYFIQLLCGQIFEHKSGSGYVSMVDIDPAIRLIGQADIAPFQETWSSASPEGRILLALLGAQRGAYEVFTQAELSTNFRAHGIQASLPDLNLVLDELVRQGTIHQLGSLSYRLSVELLRYWLRMRHPIEKRLAEYRWQPHRRRAPSPTEQAEPTRAPKTTKLTLAISVPLATLLIAVGFIFVLQTTNRTPEPSATPTYGLATKAAILLAATDTPAPAARQRATATPTAESVIGATHTATRPTATPTPTATPSPTASPTPTRPLIVARSMPAIAYMHKSGNEPWQIWAIDADGKSPTALTDGAANDTAPIWSPEGLRLAFVSERDENKEIYVMNMDGSRQRNLTNQEADDWTPAWSPDGTELVFSSMRDGNWELYLMWADGADPLRLTNDPEADFAPSWSPDGKRIAFASKRDGDWDIYAMDRNGANVRQLTNASGSDVSPAWSPDGKFIAFESTRDGNTEIYRMSAGGNDQINLSRNSSANDHWPTWSPDSQRLAFCSNRDGDWDIYVMTRDGENTVNLTNDEDNSQGPAWRP